VSQRSVDDGSICVHAGDIFEMSGDSISVGPLFHVRKDKIEIGDKMWTGAVALWNDESISHIQVEPPVVFESVESFASAYPAKDLILQRITVFMADGEERLSGYPSLVVFSSKRAARQSQDTEIRNESVPPRFDLDALLKKEREYSLRRVDLNPDITRILGQRFPEEWSLIQQITIQDSRRDTERHAFKTLLSFRSNYYLLF